MKGNLTCLLILPISCILLSSCSDGVAESGSTSKENIWLKFSQDIVAYCRDDNVENMINEYSVNIADVNLIYDLVRKSNPRANVPTIEPTDEIREKLFVKTKRVVETFIRSYKDLCDYEPATLSVRTKKEHGVESHAIIIWVEKNSGFEGILVRDVILTPSGLKTNDWLGPPADPSKSEGSMWKKRAKLQCKSIKECNYPEWFTFEYEFRS